MVGKTILIIIGFALVTLILYFSYRVDEKKEIGGFSKKSDSEKKKNVFNFEKILNKEKNIERIKGLIGKISGVKNIIGKSVAEDEEEDLEDEEPEEAKELSSEEKIEDVQDNNQEVNLDKTLDEDLLEELILDNDFITLDDVDRNEKKEETVESTDETQENDTIEDGDIEDNDFDENDIRNVLENADNLGIKIENMEEKKEEQIFVRGYDYDRDELENMEEIMSIISPKRYTRKREEVVAHPIVKKKKKASKRYTRKKEKVNKKAEIIERDDVKKYYSTGRILSKKNKIDTSGDSVDYKDMFSKAADDVKVEEPKVNDEILAPKKRGRKSKKEDDVEVITIDRSLIDPFRTKREEHTAKKRGRPRKS